MPESLPSDSMTQDTSTPDAITFAAFAPAHLDGALRLSLAAGWPHRREDSQLVLSISKGIVAQAGGKVIGTAIATPFGSVAMANTIIVDETARGRGLGRQLMTRMMALVSPLEWRLIATTEGLPLYQKLGFREVGRIVQLQGNVAAVPVPQGVEWASPADLEAIVAMDRAAMGADRASLMAKLAEVGKFAVIRTAGKLTGFAVLRAFGRGEVAGPVVACNDDDAKRLLSFLFSGRTGAFLRVDTTEGCNLIPWLQDTGLQNVGGGIAMRRGDAGAPQAASKTYALATQALG
jgi:predicted N-acetyltransferase YhbS